MESMPVEMTVRGKKKKKTNKHILGQNRKYSFFNILYWPYLYFKPNNSNFPLENSFSLLNDRENIGAIDKIFLL